MPGMEREKKRVRFRALLERAGTGPYWVIARVPVDLKKAWPEWRTRRVEGTVNGFAFRTSLIPVVQGKGFTLLVNKKMQAGASAGPGDTARFDLRPEMGPLVIAEPRELTKVLGQSRGLRKWFDAMTPSTRRWFAQYVDQAKSAETRRRRAEQLAETIMLVREGELETPPILRVEFERQPLAGEGWKAMTPSQRRRHLLGIFHARTVDGRQRRTAWVVADCMRVAGRDAPDPRGPRFSSRDDDPFDF